MIVDVITEEEYNTGHIPKAILTPNEKIKDTPPEKFPNMDAKILVYCRSENSSPKAVAKLAKIYIFRKTRMEGF